MQLYINDLATGRVTALSGSNSGSDAASCYAADISESGRFVGFVSASSVLAGESLGGFRQAMVIDRGVDWLNLPPEPEDLEFSVQTGQPLVFNLTASDPDNDSLEYRVVSTPLLGTVDAQLNQWYSLSVPLTYEADSGGDDAMTYEIRDGHGGSAQGTVTITVADYSVGVVALLSTATTANSTMSPAWASNTKWASRAAPPVSWLSVKAASAAVGCWATKATVSARCST